MPPLIASRIVFPANIARSLFFLSSQNVDSHIIDAEQGKAQAKGQVKSGIQNSALFVTALLDLFPTFGIMRKINFHLKNGSQYHLSALVPLQATQSVSSVPAPHLLVAAEL